ncbi:hypothetical protein DVH05_004083 [Phytophthora capsici]|nr:hypothetical protein DVH05_004083 [Phytophthora capsici]
MAAVAADTLRRSLKKSRQSSGSVGNSAAEAPPNPLKIDQTTECDPELDGVLSPCPSSPASTSATVGSVSEVADSLRPPIAAHSVLKSIFHHDSDIEITAASPLEAGVDAS